MGPPTDFGSSLVESPACSWSSSAAGHQAAALGAAAECAGMLLVKLELAG